MTAWRLDHVTNSCSSAGSTVRHDAKLSHATLSHADNADSLQFAARYKHLYLWRASVRRHARPVAQDGVTAAWRLDHVTNSGRSAGSTVRHDAKLTGDSLSLAGNPEAE